MLAIKAEPEDTSAWEERSNGRNIPEGDDRRARDTEIVDRATVQVTLHVNDQELLEQHSENGISVIIKREDSDQDCEGCDDASSLRKHSGQKESSFTQPIHCAEASSGNIGPGAPSSESIVADDTCTQLKSSQQLEDLTTVRQKPSVADVPCDAIHAEDMPSINLREYQGQTEKYCRKSDVPETIYTHGKSSEWALTEKTFSKKSSCNQEQTIPDDKQFTCRFCSKTFNRKGNRKIHEMSHTGNKPFKCQFCEKTFIRKQDCKTHEVTHTGEKPFKCQFCDKSFSQKHNCRSHEMTHTGKKPYKCQCCGKFFSKKQDCKNHEMKPFKCQFCGKSFSKKQDCKLHEMTHTGEKPFKCQFCEKIFRRKQDCKNHEMNHTGERPFKCQFCERSFIWKQHCKIHEMTHTGEKPFKCKFCEKSFCRTQDCKNHEMTHTGEKPFTCQFCEKSFSKKRNCKNHEMTHTGEKPFQCRYCEKSFIYKVHCKTHEMSHTGERPFTCQICGKSFTRRQHCKTHEMTHFEVSHSQLQPQNEQQTMDYQSASMEFNLWGTH